MNRTSRTPSRRPNAAAQGPLQIYLEEINETALLSAHEERELAARIADGDIDACHHMARANLRLVVNIARGYLGQGLSLEDLIEEGNLGLLRAVEGFDAGMETRFSTYASYWIKQSVRRAIIYHGKLIRLPAYMVTLLSKWKRAYNLLAAESNGTPTVEQVGAALGLTKKKIAIVVEALEVEGLSQFHGNADEDSDGLEVLPDDDSTDVAQFLIGAESLAKVLSCLEAMDHRKATVIRMRFGLEPYQPMTLREIGQEIGVTRERVRQLEAEALTELRSQCDPD